jgi:hypothetical protein
VHAALLCAAGLLSCHSGEQEREPARIVALADRAADCPACSTLLAQAPAGAFDADPHAFRCVECHDAGSGDVARPTFATCAASGCHLRAWPRTPFHNLDPAAFMDCERCHTPHAWRPRGTECSACHAAITEDAGETAVTRVAGVSAFSHARHASLECRVCHDSGVQHAALALSDRAQCQACHHDPSAGRTCATCHDAGSGPYPRGARPVRVAARLAEGAPERARTIAFDHDAHAQLSCSRCHVAGTTEGRLLAGAQRECVACHAEHDRPAADCAACHQPPPRGAHDLSVHERSCAGSGCHRAETFAHLEANRVFCLSCHTDMTAHKPGGDCAACHKVAMAVGRSR